MRKVFLEELPRGGKNIGKNHINWSLSVGKTINFSYDGIEGQLSINSYNKKSRQLELLYKNESFTITTSNLKSCELSVILGLRKREHIYAIGEILTVNSGQIQILSRTRTNTNKRSYEYICLNCKCRNDIHEDSLKRNCGCLVCANQKVTKGINDMWTTNPELATLLANPDDGYKYVEGSAIKVDWICKDCASTIKGKSIVDVNKQGLPCKKCSDNISYPEKIVFNMLEQLGYEFETQKKFNWMVDRKYDFYIEKLKCIIEVHGGQHYEETTRGRSLREEQESDRLKEKMAKANGINLYIAIDARKSDIDFIKESIMNSVPPKIFNLSIIDWVKCEESASNSLVKIVSELWNSGLHSPKLIAEKVKLGRSTVSKYLLKGKNLNWCDYSVDKSCKAGYQIRSCYKKEVVQLSKDGELINIYDSITEAANKFNVNQSSIIGCCRGRCKIIKGYKWMYKEEYDKYVEEESSI